MVADAIERLGVGMAQARVLVLAGFVWAADGAELLLINSVTRALSAEWKLTGYQRGAVVSVVFAGILAGNALGGPFGDNLGRRLPVLCAYAGCFLFSVLSATSPSYLILCAVRFFAGCSFGVGQPASVAYFSESSPIHWRLCCQAIGQFLFTFGEMYAAGLIWFSDPLMRNLDWRRLLVLGSVPALVVGLLAWAFLYESPYYLAVKGDREGALKVLEVMRHQNGMGDTPLDFEPPPRPVPRTLLERFMRPLRVIFSQRLLYTTFVLFFTTFALNVVFYGCLYALPDVVTAISMGSSPAVTLFIGAVWEVPGYAMGLFCGLCWARKPTIMLCFLLSALSLVAFIVGMHRNAQLLLQSGYMGMRCLNSMGFTVVYNYASEVYATESRTTGTSATLTAGRVGAFMAPLLVEFLAKMTAGYAGFFGFCAVVCLVDVLLVSCLPFETFGQKLEDIDRETLPLVREVVK